MANKVKYGLQNLYYAKITEGTTGDTYATPVAIPGAVSISLTSKDESAAFRADNSDYFETLNKKGYEGTIEVAELPQAFATDCLGQKVDSKGMLVESADNKYGYFALLFQVEGDTTGRRYVAYKCIATAAPEVSAQTTGDGTIEPKTDLFSFKAIGNSNGHIKARCESTATTAYDAFFTTVQEPGTFQA